MPMLSIMENNEMRQAELLAARAEVAPWVDYPANPWWWPVAGGAWAVTFAFAVSADSALSTALFWLAVLAELGWFWWVRRRWGAWPRLGSMPPEFHRPAAGFVIGLLAVVGLAMLLHPVDVAVSTAVLALGVSGVLAWYDLAYARASERTAARLGTTARVR